MIKEKLASRISKNGVRLRGEGGTRIEALSDGVFAIAIALLLISTDIPETFAELREFMYDFVPFGGTIAILMVIWYQHYTFFLRYGLQDIKTVTINTVLLFLILFYVYPLMVPLTEPLPLFWKERWRIRGEGKAGCFSPSLLL